MKRLVLCVETDKIADTDPQYIDKAIRTFYVVNNDISIKYVRMNGKVTIIKNLLPIKLKSYYPAILMRRALLIVLMQII